MTSATHTNHVTDYEVPGLSGPSEDAAAATEFESPNGLDLNNPDPDTEVVNAAAAPPAGGETEAGEPAGGDVAGLPAFDAIVGSYPELADIAEVVIPPDERVRIQNTSVYPWSAICALRITANDGRQFIGTGWLISPRTVITAGHCVFMHDAGGWARSITVTPGCNDAAQPFGSRVGTSLRSVTGWVSSKNREHDYGAIILSAPFDRFPGSFGFATRDDAFLLNAALNLSGYPGDKGGRQQWFMAQRPKSVSARVITYNIDTFGGQSGSPVWVLQNGNRHAVGVHTNGSGSGNSATRITSGVFDRLQSWKSLGA
ncbi:MAG: serine protease [Actinobacteria bacterium]|nr:serine protease [Actinomycetota bacterium]